VWGRCVEWVPCCELIWNPVVEEPEVRYKNSVLGFFWTLVNSLPMMVVLTAVFGVINTVTDTRQFPVLLLWRSRV
jgi:ABC-2 type transport system permease protein